MLPDLLVAVTVKVLMPGVLVSIAWPFATAPVHVAIGPVVPRLPQLNRAITPENSPYKALGRGETILTERPADCKASPLVVIAFGATAAVIPADRHASQNPVMSAPSHQTRVDRAKPERRPADRAE